MSIERRRLLSRISLGALMCVLLGRRGGAETLQYSYDALGRLISVTSSNGAAATYTYDAAGNRTAANRTSPNAPNGTLLANPTSLASGATGTLSWTATNTTSAAIDQGVGAVTPISGGSVSISPTKTTTYTLTLIGPAGTLTKQATVSVASAFSQPIQVTGTGPVNLRTLADAAGYNGAQDATITFQVGSGVTIRGAAGAADGGIAIDSGVWPTSSNAIAITLQVQNGGKVYGGGGAGNGGNGGDAIYCRAPMSVIVDVGGEIKAGGGGGGQGGGWQHDGKDSEGVWSTNYLYGGGGGGGFPNGAGGVPDDLPGGTGSAGTTSGGGAGGAGGTTTGHGVGAGGAGGGAAAPGATGANATGSASCNNISCWYGPGSGAPGGAAGYAIRKNGKVVTVSNAGVIAGAQA